MLNAKQANKVAEEFMRQRKEEIRMNAVDFCEKAINTEITKQAKRGGKMLNVKIPHNVDANVVVEILQKAEYQTEYNRASRFVAIAW